MIEGIQTFLKSAGESACYALCIIELAERETKVQYSIVDVLLKGIERGYIEYEVNGTNNFYVKDPAAFLSMLTNQRWTVKKTTASYVPAKEELVVQQYSLDNLSHFCLAEWDSLNPSPVRKKGRLMGYRIFRRIA